MLKSVILLMMGIIGSLFMVQAQQYITDKKLPPKNTDVTAPAANKTKADDKETRKPILNKYDYYNHLGIACKAEFKLEKVTRIPFRLRLGSLQQTDYMEQKPNAQKP